MCSGVSQWRQLSDEHFKKFSPYPQVFKWELSPGGESRFCSVRGGAMAGSPCQEIRDVIRPGHGRSPVVHPEVQEGRRKDKDPTWAALLLLWGPSKARSSVCPATSFCSLSVSRLIVH